MIDLSFVFPCLNEVKTVLGVIQELKGVLDKMNISAEIIVSDNGSTDGSVDLVQKLGCRVVHASLKGYGEALKQGFQAAQGKYIAFADIDGSYPLEYLPKMYQKVVDENADMVVASRTKGIIEKGAMPFLHRWLGTPVLTGLINFLFHGKISDCNSGFRLLKREVYEKWQMHSGGMEFASELLIKALKHKAKIVEVPTGLRLDGRSRPSHLKTWRDGMRHVLFIFSEAPNFFEKFGFVTIALASLLEVLSIILGPIRLERFSFFDYHTKLILLGIMILGVQSYLFSAFIYALKAEEKPSKLTVKVLSLKEETLFIICVVSTLLFFVFLMIFINFWAMHEFQNIFAVRTMIDIMYLLLLILMFSFGLIQIHLFKRLKGN